MGKPTGFPDAVYYEPKALAFPLGKQLKRTYAELPWIEIENHNNIPEMRKSPNSAFPKLKRHLIIGVRKTHKYVPNHKVSDYLVPYTSSGCSAMCLYCYLVCHYNKCAYLRLFVNREDMLDRLIRHSDKADSPMTYEIGSNSDLVLENTVTGNLPWTIERFAQDGRGFITFPTKFSLVEPLLPLHHCGKTVFRMSLNPEEIIRKTEFGTAPLVSRIKALNEMCKSGYPVGIIIAPVILLPDWKNIYGRFLELLSDELSNDVKESSFIEIILMTYSYVQNAINTDAFPNAVTLYNREHMTGRGKGKYRYREPVRSEAEVFLRDKLSKTLGCMEILYVV
ncbi:MAG: spore photoproduct lyase [Clostridiales bacterium]|nr:spore photoproduct lyase [Clostridiales bacterium]